MLDLPTTATNDADTIARLKAEALALEALIRTQAVTLAHAQKIFARASIAARIGVWECSLPDETLQWTDVVYDIFDLPRGSVLDRSETVKCYSEQAAKELHRLRTKAIEDRTGFEMDAEIITVKGNRKWIRLTATVECENDIPIRIFGMKQDITDQKILMDRTKYLAEFDLMTGLANRSQFQSTLSDLCEGNGVPGSGGALLLVDLDGFKSVNDTFGHAAGDECLKEIARRLIHVGGETEVVARIGGDEFAVLLGPQINPVATLALAHAIVDALSDPVAYGDQQVAIGASVGIALVDGCNASDLFKKADFALYAAKSAGKNTFHLFEHSNRFPGRELRQASP